MRLLHLIKCKINSEEEHFFIKEGGSIVHSVTTPALDLFHKKIVTNLRNL